MLYVLGGVLLMAMGVLMFLRPDVFYDLTEGWKSKGGRPSRLYCVSTRLGGVMCILAGLCGIVLPLL